MCAFCNQTFSTESFQAYGEGAMEAQSRIVLGHIKASMIRTVAAYATSSLFAVTSALIVIFAPASRATAADIFAGGFLTLAVGIAGFTHFRFKASGIELGASTTGSHTSASG